MALSSQAKGSGVVFDAELSPAWTAGVGPDDVPLDPSRGPPGEGPLALLGSCLPPLEALEVAT